MARTNHNSHPGKDWWGKRPLAGTAVSRHGMKFWKRLLHKIERQMGRKESTKYEDSDYEQDHRRLPRFEKPYRNTPS